MKLYIPNYRVMSEPEVLRHIGNAIEDIQCDVEACDAVGAEQTVMAKLLPALAQLKKIRSEMPDLDRAYDDSVDKQLMEADRD